MGREVEQAFQMTGARVRQGITFPGTQLQAGEVLRIGAGVPQVVYYRSGREECPLAVFLPGGGHMARVAYGHTGAEPRDFIDAWLADEGYGLLALSYPSDHAAFPSLRPDLSILEWASSIAELVREHVCKTPSREIVVLGWSGAGRSVVAIERALRSRGLGQLCFVSLAATAPLPNLFPSPVSLERFTEQGFWDSSTRHRQWWKQVKHQVGAMGGPAIGAKTYLRHYVVNSPFPLRGQARANAPSGASVCLAEEIGAFSYEDYPTVAAVIPEGVDDRLHAFTDCATWGAINVQRIARGPGKGVEVPAADWPALRDLICRVPQRLSRTIQGGHFFFIGEVGAMTTVRKVMELTGEARSFRDELQSLAGARNSSMCPTC
jgi:hypothetical protein